MWRWVWRVPVAVAFFSSLLRAGGHITVTDRFESGSLGTWRVVENTRLILTPRLEYDQDGINSAATWFYAKLSNVLHREVRIEFENLVNTVYNGKQSDLLPYQRGTAPVFSYDGVNWERFTDCRFDLEAGKFLIRQIFSRDPVWVAYIPPYTFSRLEALLGEIGKHPAVVVESMGASAEGRPLYLVSVDEPGTDLDSRPVVWIVARQHAFEAGGSWAVEGLLRFLTSAGVEAAVMRRQVAFKVCPMLNPDAVVAGGTRFNARGVDLNRHWSSADPLSDDRERAPEIALVKGALRRWLEEHRLDLWINIHNNDMVWNEDGDYIRFAPGERDTEARLLEKILREETIFTGPFEPSLSQEATEAVVAAETGALSLLMEMKTGFLEREDRWTGTDVFLAHGRGVARAAVRFLGSPGKDLEPAPIR